MKRHIQLEPLKICLVDSHEWTQPIHSHNFFELVIIQEGTGNHTINGNCFPYSTGHVFLLGPTDNHFFTILERTRFCFISFTESYLAGLTVASNSIWKRGKFDSLHMAMGFSGNLITNSTNQLNLNSLVSVLLSNNDEVSTYFSSVVSSIMGAILSIIEPQISIGDKRTIQSSSYTAEVVHQVVAYISQHIMEPERLRIEHLASKFNYSSGYLSALFKQQVGESLQQYIIQYRLKLVEKRLRFSSLTVSQIADEFGFTDICHLNKLFKQHYQQTPMVYRRTIAAM